MRVTVINGVRCPCGSFKSKRVNTNNQDGCTIRRYQCLECNGRFTTKETLYVPTSRKETQR